MPRIDSDLDVGGGGGGIVVETDPTALKINNNLSDVANANTSLNNILPSQTGNAGKVLSTNGTDSSWITSPSGSSNTTELSITGTINNGTFSVTTSGVNYTKTRDNGFLGNNVTDFTNTETIQIYLNGQLLIKGEDVNYVSSTSFSLVGNVYSGDKLIIFS